MSGYSAFRLFFRLEKPGRIPFFGNVGVTSATPHFQRQQLKIQQETGDKQKAASNGITVVPLNKNFYWRRYYSTTVSTTDVLKAEQGREAAKKKPKTVESPKIMLVSETNHISVVTMEEAQKLAQKKHLNIVPGDKKLSSDKQVYKLVKSADILSMEDSEADPKDSSKKEDKKREAKTVILKSKTAEHDVLSKVKQMTKWIEKEYPIRVLIAQAGEKGDVDQVYKLIEENMKPTGARFQQKVVKGGQVRFQILPPKEDMKKADKRSAALQA